MRLSQREHVAAAPVERDQPARAESLVADVLDRGDEPVPDVRQVGRPAPPTRCTVFARVPVARSRRSERPVADRRLAGRRPARPRAHPARRPPSRGGPGTCSVAVTPRVVALVARVPQWPAARSRRSPATTERPRRPRPGTGRCLESRVGGDAVFHAVHHPTVGRGFHRDCRDSRENPEPLPRPCATIATWRSAC